MKILVFINVDWYCKLHWKDRLINLRKEGNEIYLLTKFTDNNIKLMFQKEGIICRNVDIKRQSINIFYEIKILIILYFIVKNINPDAIHTITVKPNIYGGIISRILGITRLVTVTGLGTIFNENSSLNQKIIRFFINLIYKFISSSNKSFFIFENKEDLEKLSKSGIVKKSSSFLVSGAGVDTFVYSPNIFKIEQRRKVLFAARLIWSKGLKDLIEAKNLVKNSKDDFELIVAGIEDDDAHDAIPVSYLEKAHKKGLLTWLGHVTEMPSLLNSVNLVVLPTTYKEGLPRILVEAASCGKPLIATDMPGCRDIVLDGKNGRLVPPHNSKVLSETIVSILNDESLQDKYSKESRNIVLNKFSNSVVLEEYSNFYKLISGL